METNFENGKHADKQLRLILEREALLYKITSRIKTIRGYLSELSEIRKNLKTAGSPEQTPAPIESF